MLEMNMNYSSRSLTKKKNKNILKKKMIKSWSKGSHFIKLNMYTQRVQSNIYFLFAKTFTKEKKIKKIPRKQQYNENIYKDNSV